MVENVCSWSKAFPVPTATHDNGSSAMWTGKPVSFENRLSIFFNKAPPPVNTRPISTKSAESSGGVLSKASLIPLTICFKISFRASAVSSSVIFTSFGVPDLRSGTPKEVNITEEDTAEALNGILREMVNGIKDALESTPPELSADLVDMGLTLTGGGALLKNIDKRFSKETGLPVHIADDPLSCVAVGTGKALDQEQTFSTMLTEY